MSPNSRTVPKERGLICRGPEALAIWGGQQSQVRRLVKPQPKRYEVGGGWGLSWGKKCVGGSDWMAKYCPFGKVGDLLFVREAFQKCTGCNAGNGVIYRAGC